MTKKYKRLYVIFTILSCICFIGPIAYFTIQAFVADTALVSKVALSSTLLIVVILSVVAMVNKIAMRSRLWILLIGLFICLDHFIVIIVTIGICQIIDELIFSPLKKYYETKYKINKEIDARL